MEAIAELRAYHEAMSTWDGGHALPRSPRDNALCVAAIDALRAELRQAKQDAVAVLQDASATMKYTSGSVIDRVMAYAAELAGERGEHG